MGVLTAARPRLRPAGSRRAAGARPSARSSARSSAGSSARSSAEAAPDRRVRRTLRSAPRSVLRAAVEAIGRIPRPGLVPVTTVALVLMIAVGVAFQAQRVAGQDRLQEVRIEMRDASRLQAELRAELAEAEAPAQILEAAADLGMVEPAAAVAVAARPTGGSRAGGAPLSRSRPPRASGGGTPSRSTPARGRPAAGRPGGSRRSPRNHAASTPRRKGGHGGASTAVSPSSRRRRSQGNRRAGEDLLHRRVRLLVAVLVVAAAIPVWKLLGVIVGDGGGLVASGEAQGVRQYPIAALRGPILDRHGAELAISLPRVLIAADLRALGELAEDDPMVEGRFVAVLAEATGVDEQDLIDTMAAAAPDDPWVKLVDAATPEQADDAGPRLLDAGLLPALVLEDTSVRVHPSGESGLRLVGTLGPDGPGPGRGDREGPRRPVAGHPRHQVVEQSPAGDVIAGSERVTDAPQEGASVQLTLDRNLQYEVERVLLRGAGEAGANGGVAVVGRPSTGELLAVAGVDRDPDTGELRLAPSPKAFADAHQAGSVFKLVPVSAAIEDGHVELESTLSVPWRINLYDRTFSDHDEHPTKDMAVRDIVARSSNVGTIKLAQMLGPQRLHDALVDFGFGRRTGIANPAESAGLLPEAADWSGPDIGASAIGTLQSATAVQLWAAYNVIANDGIYVAPRLVDKVERADGASYGSEVEGAEARRVVSEDTAAQVEDALQRGDHRGDRHAAGPCPGSPRRPRRARSRMPSPERTDSDDGYVWPDGRYHYLNAFTGYLPARRPPAVDHRAAGGRGPRPDRFERRRPGVLRAGPAGHPRAGDRRAATTRASPACVRPARRRPPAGSPRDRGADHRARRRRMPRTPIGRRGRSRGRDPAAADPAADGDRRRRMAARRPAPAPRGRRPLRHDPDG